MGSKINCIGIIILLIAVATSSKAEQLSSRQRGYGLIKFEGDQQAAQDQRQHGTIKFQEQAYSQGNSQPFRFDETHNFREDPPEDNRNPQSNIELNNAISSGQVSAPNHAEDGINTIKAEVTFQDDNRIEEQKGQKKRKRRRRRKPRLQQFPAPGAYPGGYPNPTPGSGYQIQGTGYPTSGSGYPIQGSGYPTPGSGYPTPGSGYPTPGSGYPIQGTGYPAPVSGNPVTGPGYPNSGSGYPTQGPGYPAPYGQNSYGNPAFGPGHHRPLRRPRPQSVASDAIVAVTEALASIARYDDYQCVPRLLCEAAGGGALAAGAPGTGAGSGLLQSITALQPLLTLLSAYNGISASPLFIFGRAVFLGMTSRGAPGSPGAPATCRYAYPLCPTDPEQLVHYLNNHNGGFFRFFNAPQRPNPQYGLQQNLEQFYNQLAAPGLNTGQYGFYQPAENLGGSPGQYGQLGYPTPGAAQGYGLYNGDPNQQYDPNYQIPASNDYQGYGANYLYRQQKYGLSNVGFKKKESEIKGVNTNEIEERIQNIKSDESDEDNYSSNVVDRNKNSKWLFPNTYHNEDHPHRNDHTKRENKHFSFPRETFKSNNSDTNRKGKGFNFPGAQSNRDLDIYAYEETVPVQDNAVFNSYHHDSHPETPQNGEEDVEVVYVVRGDGDPNNPEIVKLKPGQSIQSIGFL